MVQCAFPFDVISYNFAKGVTDLSFANDIERNLEQVEPPHLNMDNNNHQDTVNIYTTILLSIFCKPHTV